MELAPLQVGEHGAGAVGERGPVGRGDARVGRPREQVAHAARGQHHAPAASRGRGNDAVLVAHQQPGDCVVAGRSGQARRSARAIGRYADPLRTTATTSAARCGRRSRRPRRGRRAAAVGALAGRARGFRRGRGRRPHRGRSARRTRAGPSAQMSATGVEVAQPGPGRERVGSMWLSTVSPSPMAAARPPCACWRAPGVDPPLVTRSTGPALGRGGGAATSRRVRSRRR